MNLYRDGVFDPEAARDELLSALNTGNTTTLDTTTQAVQTAALIDIAASLGTLAAESAERMYDAGVIARPTVDDPDDDTPERDPDDDTDGGIDVGDWVVHNVTDYDPEPREVIAVGVSEGAAWLTYAKPENDSTSGKLWASDYARIDLDAWRAEHPGWVPIAERRELDAPDLADLVDDIDQDFTGDSHPTAEAAVTKLSKAERKARKAAKAAKA